MLIFMFSEWNKGLVYKIKNYIYLEYGKWNRRVVL